MHDVQRADGEQDQWSGDLRDFVWQGWAEPGEIAAVLVVSGHRAALWTNLAHVPAGVAWLVWLWGRRQAELTSGAVLFADELPAWHLPPGGHRAEMAG